MNSPLISVIIPCLNEAATIEGVLAAIFEQSLPVAQMEVIIADAMSIDGTRRKISEFHRAHPQLSIKVIENCMRSIPAGLNLAIAASRGDIITRMDAHSIPANDYIEKSVNALTAGYGDNVGGVIDIRPSKNTWMGRSIAIATAHPLGVGDARYRWTSKPMQTDTVAFGTYKRSLVTRIGNYDESLLMNEDYEFNSRIRSNGGKVWVDPAIRAVYFSRPDLRSLSRQYFWYGFWKIQMLKRFPSTLRWRQALPPLFVCGILMLLLLSPFLSLARYGLGITFGIYYIVLLAGAIFVALKNKKPSMALGVPLAIMTMHFSWGSGFWWGMLKGTTRGSNDGK